MRARERRDHRHRGRHGAEDATLRLDHLQAHVMEFRKVRRTAIGEHDAAEASVIGFAHRRVHADLGGYATDQQRFDATVLEHQLQIGLVEGALARLVDHRLAGSRIKLRDDVVAGLAAYENAAHRARGADAQRRIATLDFDRRSIGEVRSMPFSGVNHEHIGSARGHEDIAHGPTAALRRETSLPSAAPKPPGSKKSRCISMMMSAVRPVSTVTAAGSASMVRTGTTASNYTSRVSRANRCGGISGRD